MIYSAFLLKLSIESLLEQRYRIDDATFLSRSFGNNCSSLPSKNSTVFSKTSVVGEVFILSSIIPKPFNQITIIWGEAIPAIKDEKSINQTKNKLESKMENLTKRANKNN